MKLKVDTVDKLKMWNEKYPTILYDRKYLKELLKYAFGMECLALSSVGGKPARNKNVQHAALDKIKLKFIAGK